MKLNTWRIKMTLKYNPQILKTDTKPVSLQHEASLKKCLVHVLVGNFLLGKTMHLYCLWKTIPRRLKLNTAGK